MQKHKKKGGSVQDLLGIKTFTRYGLATKNGELVFFLVSPTNISVLSHASIEAKIHHLMMVLCTHPDIEIVCTDSQECFDANKAFLQERLQSEQNPEVKKLLRKDVDFLDRAQAEMSTARQFLFVLRCRNLKPEQVFAAANAVEKTVSEQGFEAHRMKKAEIKRFLATYFEASMNGDAMPDGDGEQYLEREEDDS